MSEPSQVALGLLAVVGTLSGVWFGWRLGMSERLRQWRRDKQIDSYSELIASSAELAATTHQALVAETSEEHALAGRSSEAAQLRFHNALHRAVIVAARAVRPSIDELADLTNDAMRELYEEQRDEVAIGELQRRAAKVRQNISEAARLDLGFGGR